MSNILDAYTDYAAYYKEVSDWMISSYITLNRPILDFIHSMFTTAFNVVLIFTVIISLLFLVMSIYAIYRKKDPTSSSKYVFDEKNAPFITIQIPTYNELAALNCAKKCLDMHYPEGKYEIIIGDDSNKPEISRKIDAFAAKYPGIVKVTRRGSNIGFKPGNLNHMLQYTRGEIIVLFDSDFLPDKDFLQRIVAPFQYDKKIAGVQGRWKFINNGQNIYAFMGSLIVEGFHYIYLPFMKRFGKLSFLCGSGEAIRTNILIAKGGWRSGSLTEDIEYSIRILKDGYKIVYLEDVEVYCEAPFTAKDLYKQQKRWAYGVVLSLITHFKSVVSSKKVDARTKTFIQFQGLGYVFTLLLGLMFFTGMIALVSHRPAPVDWNLFLSETFRNIVLSSGALIVSLVALWKTGRLRLWWKAIFASFSVGIVLLFYVNEGIFKAILGGRMEWFMLKKLGNNTKNVKVK